MMFEIHKIHPPVMEGLSPFAKETLYQNFSLSLPDAQNADMHLVVTSEDVPVARASLWWNDFPAVEYEIPGVIGHFEAVSKAGAIRLLNYCCSVLKQQGCTLAVGPMDGNTWNRYRLVTWSGEEPSFFLEPTNPPEYPDYFQLAGFQSHWQYFSAKETGISGHDPRIPDIEARMEKEGITIRAFRSQDFEAELRRIYTLSVIGFQNNLFYNDISEEQFMIQYQPFKGQIIEDLVLLAECEGEPVGFVFAFPDLAQQQRGVAVDTVVLKSLAILPGRKTAGLGALLTDRIRVQTSAMGLDKIVYALMHESNYSKTISNRNNGKRIRTYSLFSKELMP